MDSGDCVRHAGAAHMAGRAGMEEGDAMITWILVMLYVSGGTEAYVYVRELVCVPSHKEVR